MKLEFVGGPKCGEWRDVETLPSSIDTTYEVPPRTWIASYKRTGTRMAHGNHRYVFAGQRLIEPAVGVNS